MHATIGNEPAVAVDHRACCSCGGRPDSSSIDRPLSYPRSPPMTANIGFLAWLPGRCSPGPRRSPRSRRRRRTWMAFVAFAGMVRNLYTGDALPMRNAYSVPGVSPANCGPEDLEVALRERPGDGLLNACQVYLEERPVALDHRPGRYRGDDLLGRVIHLRCRPSRRPTPTHCTSMVVVGSRVPRQEQGGRLESPRPRGRARGLGNDSLDSSGTFGSAASPNGARVRGEAGD